MAVVTSGNETIVRYSRGLIVAYYSLVAASGVICLLALMVAFGAAKGNGSWKDKGWSVGGWILTSLSFGLLAIQVYMMSRAYVRAFVAIGPDGVRMRLPRSDGDLLGIGREMHLKWDEISDITYESSLRMRVCRFTAGDLIYTLNRNNCPSPGTVAKLPAERKGVALTAPKVTR